MNSLSAQTPVDYTPQSRTDLTIDTDSHNEALHALSSETAQSILGTLSERPKPPSEIAETTTTSVQNVQYHLERLETTGLVKPIDTVYSSKGRKMTVYAPTARRLVVQFETDRE
jgi:predicted transcriptional regulator